MEINYNSAPGLESFLKLNGLGMHKKFGQNFLVNQEIRLRLVDALGAVPGEEVCEIGPGLGAMTRHLLDNELKVKAFEVDKGFIRVLHEYFDKDKRFTLIEGNVLKTWPNQAPAKFLLGNLPYNIAAALIGDFIEKKCFFQTMVITIQKELAQRMIAAPGSKDYSSFSVLCSSVYKVKKLMSVHRSSFYPQPHVDSYGIKLELSADYNRYPALFYPLVRALFLSRRKTIKNNLLDYIRGIVSVNNTGNEKSAAVYSDNICTLLLEKSRLNGMERAETLDIDTFLRLAQILEDMRILNRI